MGLVEVIGLGLSRSGNNDRIALHPVLGLDIPGSTCSNLNPSDPQLDSSHELAVTVLLISNRLSIVVGVAAMVEAMALVSGQVGIAIANGT